LNVLLHCGFTGVHSPSQMPVTDIQAIRAPSGRGTEFPQAGDAIQIDVAQKVEVAAHTRAMTMRIGKSALNRGL
jgi:hypothetical protein